MPDFWRNSGYRLLRRDACGRLEITDDYLRAYYLRPEIHPVEDSCERECALHTALMEHPRREIEPAEIDAIADADARDNYRVLQRFRRRLLSAGTIERCYLDLFQGDVDVPPLFISQLAHVILRNVLDGCEDALQLRVAELFFRDQKATFRDGHVLLADEETVEMHAAGSRYGSVGRLIVEAQGTIGKVELRVLDRDNASEYWERESRYDTVVGLSYGQAALDALCRVIESWVAHLLGVAVRVSPLRAIDEARWAWHVGLDAEASSILNDLWNSIEVEHGRMRRVIALFRLEFADRADARAVLAGQPVYMGLAANARDIVRMKPQNLLLNLPLASRS
jgi:hypothetical protein